MDTASLTYIEDTHNRLFGLLTFRIFPPSLSQWPQNLQCRDSVVAVSVGTGQQRVSCSLHFDQLCLSVMVDSAAKRIFFDKG